MKAGMCSGRLEVKIHAEVDVDPSADAGEPGSATTGEPSRLRYLAQAEKVGTYLTGL